MRGQTRKKGEMAEDWFTRRFRLGDSNRQNQWFIGQLSTHNYRRRPVCLPPFRRHLCPGSSTCGDIEAQRAIPDSFTYSTHCSSRTLRASSSTVSTSTASTDDCFELTAVSAPSSLSANYPRPDWRAYRSPIRCVQISKVAKG